MDKKVFVNILQKNSKEKANTFDEKLLNIKTQRNILQCLYFKDNNSVDDVNNGDKEYKDDINENELCLKREIKNKIQGYKQQDKKNKCYDNDFFISLYDVYELLISSRLKCYYCKNNIYILYNNNKQSNQWTLDRIKNDQGHNKNNCVISCLKCNLDRKTTDCKKFLFTKQMKIIKGQ